MNRLGSVLVWLVLVSVPATAQVPDEFTNLKLFPKDIGKRELVSSMRQFAGALGVRCKHCHVGPDNLEGMDFATDELEPKRVARAMMKMTQEINDRLMPTTGRSSALAVRCVTCHRGVTRPEQIGDILEASLESDGVDGALARYEELRDEYYGGGAYDFSPGTLNALAETLAREKGDLDGAIEVLILNVELYPNDANGHIFLGQLYVQKGDPAAARASLQRALELEPDNEMAKRMLERIEAPE